MPIKGHTDKTRLPRQGKIHLGIKKEKAGKGGRKVEYPAATDYFVCPPEITPYVGEEPKLLTVMLAHKTPEEAFPEWLKCYRASGLFCSGDGENAKRLVDGDYQEIVCPYQDCEYYLAGECKPVGTFKFMLPDVPGLGVWWIDSKGWRSGMNIRSTLALLFSMTGNLAGLSCDLKLVEEEAMVEGKKKTVYILHLTSDLTLREVVAGRRGLLALPEPEPESELGKAETKPPEPQGEEISGGSGSEDLGEIEYIDDMEKKALRQKLAAAGVKKPLDEWLVAAMNLEADEKGVVKVPRYLMPEIMEKIEKEEIPF